MRLPKPPSPHYAYRMRAHFLHILRILPKNQLSFILGSLARIRVPYPFSFWLVKVFARFSGADISLSKKEIKDFPCIGDFFIRELKPGVRPIQGSFVSPIDGTLRECGHAVGGLLPQIKEEKYSIAGLLESSTDAARYDQGIFYNFYLSPKDYHRVHSPCAGKIIRVDYIPGALWPVNGWSLRQIPRLFCKNERMVIYLQSAYGILAVVMVGATNVGKISLSFSKLESNTFARCFTGGGKAVQQLLDVPVEVAAGDELGIFHLGSSVVLLVEAGSALPFHEIPRQTPVEYGQSLIKK